MNIPMASQKPVSAVQRPKEIKRGRPKKTKSEISTAAGAARNNGHEIRSVIHALDLLEAICADEVLDSHDKIGELRLTRLSRQLGLSKSAVFRLLATFERRGYVEHLSDAGIYRIGMNAFEVGRRLLTRMHLLQLSRPIMEELGRRCNEAVYLAIRRGSEFLFMDLVESAQQVKIAPLVGKRFPLERAAPGQVILAYSEAVVSLESESAEGWRADIRRQGFCHEQGGLGEMVGCLATPLFDGTGEVGGVLCLVSPAFRLSEVQIEESFWPLLKEAGETISFKLGYMKPYMGGGRL